MGDYGRLGGGYERILAYIERSTGLIELELGQIERWTRCDRALKQNV